MDRRKLLVTLLAGGKKQWTPATPIGGYLPIFWHEARLLTGYADGDAVTSVTDFSANANHGAQETAGSRALYKANIFGAKPALLFDGTDDQYATPAFLDATYNNAFTYFCVSHPSAPLSGTKVAMSNGASLFYTSRDGFGFQHRLDLLSTNDRVNGGYSKRTGFDKWMDAGTYNGSSIVIYTNGNRVTLPASGNAALNGALTIGALAGGSLFWPGYISAMLIYKAALSYEQVLQVSRYLSTQNSIPLCTRRIVANGDSMTIGAGSTAGFDYLSQLHALNGSPVGDYYFNFAVNGRTLATIATATANEYDKQYSPDAVCVAPLWAGTNDLKAGTSGADLLATYVSVMQGRQTTGYKTIAYTALPRQDAALPADFETQRATYNDGIRNNLGTFADGLVDCAADVRLQDPTNATYFNADRVHLTNAGYAVIAGLAKTAIDAAV